MPVTLVAGDYWTELRLPAMGTRAYIVLGDAPRGLEQWAAAELERLEQCWSRFRDDSELAHVNASEGGWVPISATMLLALTCARDLYALTGGRFDPTVLDALERAGYDRSFESLVPDGALFVARRAPGFGTVDIDVELSRVRVPAGVRIDLGGVGKGLAADLVARGLVHRGARSVLVSLGGDLRVRGEAPPDGPWRVPVEDPFDETRVAFVHELADGALVTSTCRFRAWKRHGRSFHHLIDPARGDSAHAGVTAVVAASHDAWFAEGIAKAVVIAGVDDGAQLAHDNGVHTWIFCDDGRVVEAGA